MAQAHAAVEVEWRQVKGIAAAVEREAAVAAVAMQKRATSTLKLTLIKNKRP